MRSGDPELANYFFEHKVLNTFSSYGGKCFSLDPFGEIVDATSRYLTCPRAYGKCPCISIPHQSNGHGDAKWCNSFAGACCMSRHFWHLSHFRT